MNCDKFIVPFLKSPWISMDIISNQAYEVKICSWFVKTVLCNFILFGSGKSKWLNSLLCLMAKRFRFVLRLVKRKVSDQIHFFFGELNICFLYVPPWNYYTLICSLSYDPTWLHLIFIYWKMINHHKDEMHMSIYWFEEIIMNMVLGKYFITQLFLH